MNGNYTVATIHSMNKRNTSKTNFINSIPATTPDVWQSCSFKGTQYFLPSGFQPNQKTDTQRISKKELGGC